MKCMFLNVHYLQFINSHYENYPGLENASYEEQKAAMNATFFGDGDLYTEGLKAAGWEADDLVQNCDQLQRAWARENGFPDDDLDNIWVEQVIQYEPDVVYTQLPYLLDCEDKPYSRIRPLVKLIVGQQTMSFGLLKEASFDILFTHQSTYIQKYKDAGIDAHYLPFAFEPRVLDLVGPQSRDYPVTFVGHVTGSHTRRRAVLEHLSTLGIDCWGPGADETGNRHHGIVWGLDMFEVLCRSKITINCTIDYFVPYVGNMRLYEGTGCGALMITDHGEQLDDLYEKDVEIVTYTTPEECMYLVRYYLDHPDEAAEIARRGQKKTLWDHTYTKRMEYVAEILENKLRRI